MADSKKAIKFIKRHAPELIAGSVLVYVAYRFQGHRLVPTEGHFIHKTDFQRLLDTDDQLFLATPLGLFQVLPDPRK